MIKRYECFTGHEATNYDATVTEDGPWVSYDDHAEEIATLRANVERWVKEVAHLKLAAAKAERESAS